jgi:hypothetical protein
MSKFEDDAINGATICAGMHGLWNTSGIGTVFGSTNGARLTSVH